MFESNGLRARAWLGGRAVLVASVLLASPATLAPASATPVARPAVSEADKLMAIKTQGDKAQRIAETRQRRWDTKMKAVSGSICNGC